MSVFPAPLEVDRWLYAKIKVKNSSHGDVSPAPREVNRVLYFRRGHRMKRFIAIWFPAPPEVDRYLY